MSPCRLFAGSFGAVYLLVGALDVAVTGASQATHQLLGVFELNALHTVVHLAVGGLGIAAFQGGIAVSRSYALGLAVVYGVIVIVGFLPQPLMASSPSGERTSPCTPPRPSSRSPPSLPAASPPRRPPEAPPSSSQDSPRTPGREASDLRVLATPSLNPLRLPIPGVGAETSAVGTPA